MKFTFAHNNLNVYDLDKSLEFYKEALGLTVTRTKDADDGSFTLVYLGDGTTPHLLELTWLRDMDRPYNLGDNEIKWDAYVLRIRRWESTSSQILTVTGLRSYLRKINIIS